MDSALETKIKTKVAAFESRLHELERLLSDENSTRDVKRFRELSQEHSYIRKVMDAWDKKNDLEKKQKENVELAKEASEDMLELIREDTAIIEKELEKTVSELQLLIIPPNPYDNANTILELRAGTGGQEAMLFVADCVRMYQMYATKLGWRTELLSATPSDLGGYKEYIMVVSGENAYRYLQFEAGTHRVQRVPDTEAQGRIHTSTITVAALVEPEEDSQVVLNESELRIETTRSSGAGGQHVNKTDSAVRVTHLPTGIVVFCQEERSQHKNKEKAFRYLRARIAEVELQKKKDEIDSKRLAQVGTGERSEKIRTYNFPQNRCTDHRINLTKYNLDGVMNGDLEEFSRALVAHFQEDVQ